MLQLLTTYVLSGRWFKCGLLSFLLYLLVLACNLPQVGKGGEENLGLNLSPRGTDGSVSGTYIFSSNNENKTVRFSVSTEGEAVFQINGAPDTERLTISMPDENTASMQWAGISLDGYGALSPAEMEAMAALSASDLFTGLSLIPLDIACLGNELVDPQQVAALLFPLQMHFKVQVTDRSSVAKELMASAKCTYTAAADNSTGQSAMVYFTQANPIPVVIGYFPFNAEGAVEPHTASGQNHVQLVGFPFPRLSVLFTPAFQVYSILPETTSIIRDQWGPCQAKCRGACGADCTLNNCTLTADYRCEVDENGNNTGQISYLHIYDCGLHPACIKHDQCYDDCNQRYGCGTFKAAHCRHGGWNDGVHLPENYYCDKHTVHEESLSNVKEWVDGFGPQPIRQAFVYTDEKLAFLEDLENCPLEAEAVKDPPTAEVETSETALDDIFWGQVVADYKGNAPVWEILESIVEIKLTGETIQAAIEYTQHSTIREGGDAGGVCNATFTRILWGEGLISDPVSLKLESVSDEIHALEGPACDKGGGWNTHAREDLLASFEKNATYTLEGQFFDDRFEGSLPLTFYTVIAVKGDK